MVKAEVKAKVYIFEKQFEGLPKQTDLKLIEEELPDIKDGEFLAEAVFLSVDPFMRLYAPNLKTGTTFIGFQVAKIVESKNEKFPVGKYVIADFGWRNYTISDGESKQLMLLPDFGPLPLSYALGALGMPGNTAYFGLLEICQAKSGDTVVISAAGGAVGSLVGQIAKIKGCKVIGIAGSDEKGKWLLDLKFDHFINYKTEDINQALSKLAPEGVDCYFDNVGGELSHAVLLHMKKYGRIAVCGAISNYNNPNIKAPVTQNVVLMKELKMKGFQVARWMNRWMEGIEQNTKWMLEGKLKAQETITNGFENMFQAFVDMLQGKNVGKAIVKV